MPTPQLPVPILPSPDQFPAYARAVAEIPALSAQDEYDLAVQWRDHANPEAARALVLAHLYLVVKAVREHSGYGLPQGDLAQEGTVGLMKAVKKFDPARGVRLGTYAWYWIEAEIREFVLKNWRMVSWGTSSLAKKLFFGYRKTVAQLRDQGEERSIPSSQEIANAMDVSLADAEMARSYFLGGDVFLFDEHGEDQKNESSKPTRFLALPAASGTPEDEAVLGQQDMMIAKMHAWVKDLPEKQRQVVSARFLQDPPQTLAAVAKQMDLSIERVRQIEHAALELLRKKAKNFS